MKQYDVVFLGSGHAAWHAALTLRQANQSVAIIEKDRIAGTCTNYGCNAKILLENPYEVLEQASHYPDIIKQNDLSVNWEELMNYKHKVINPMADLLKSMFEQQGIDVYDGFGKFVDEHTIEVNGESVYGEHIVVATGQHSHKLDIEGKELTRDSRDFLSMDHMPQRIVMIGSGIISVEFASIAIKAGSEVHIIHHNDEPLKGFYREHVNQLIDKLKNEGVQFHFNENTQAVKESGNAYVVETESGLFIEADYVLDATGRKPNVQHMGLEDIGVNFSEKGIPVDSNLRTNIPHIYASGDVLDKSIPKLTPTATFESNYIAAHILGMNTQSIQYPAIPSVIYSLPRLSQIGVSIEEAQESEDYKVVEVPFGERMVFEYKNEVEATMTIVLDKERRLVGAAIYADDAPDLVNLLAMIINQKMSAQDLNQMIFAFPGPTSGVIDLLKISMIS